MSIKQTDVSALLNGIDNKNLSFKDVINYIDDFYRFTPVDFVNGEVHNYKGENEGSAKIFAFAKHHNLGQVDTLKLFAEHYASVLATPNGVDHANIRNFMHWGWKGFLMEKNPLTLRPNVDVKNI